MRILITGAKGRLGNKLVNILQNSHDVTGVDLDEFDFTDVQQTRRFIVDVAPNLILHCGAMTAVDECALNPDEAIRVNGFGTKNVVMACQEINAALLYVSTNEVFDGRNTGYIREYDSTSPANAYGYSKWIGEQIIRDHLTRFYITRTSWLFAHGGRNFIQAIVSRAKDGLPLRVVVNEVAVPTYNDDLAQAIAKLIETGPYGIYHLVNEGRASRWSFARKILDLIGMENVEIEKISAAEYPRPSSPPEYSVLKNSAAAALGITLRPWEAALQAFIEKEGLNS
ncbi:MAG TPA: dTDP-4-dehydrorhamnose reductase [Aggregatilineales bacterium]|nr:dTDP-4-dehydrorhamnose reductase [Aggregatilineales bacterium]